MGDRVRAQIAVHADAWRAEGPLRKRSRLVDVEDLEALVDELERYGPEPVGFVIEVDQAGLEQLPVDWHVERRVGVAEDWWRHSLLEEPEAGDAE